MSVPYQEILDEILRCIEELQQEQIPILVEGRNDRKAMLALGLRNIIVLNKPLYKIVEHLQLMGKVAILTDFDWRGRKLFAQLRHECSTRGITMNNRLRIFLKKETSVVHMEGLATFVENLERKKLF